MLVPEDSLFKKNIIKLNIVGKSGEVFCIDADKRWSIDLLKIKAVAHFCGVGDSSKQSLYYKLVSVRKNAILNETNSIMVEQVAAEDEILLIKKRMDIPEFEDPKKQGDKAKAPTAEDIRKATEDLLPKNVESRAEEQPTAAFFQKELRKILITLIDTAHRLHCMDPQLNQLFLSAEKNEDEEPKKTSGEPKLNYNESTLRQLTDMGFSEELAKTALHRNNNVPSQAIQWIIDHEGSSAELEIGVEVTESTKLESAGSEAKCSNTASSSSNVNTGRANQIESSQHETGATGGSDVTDKQVKDSEEKSSQLIFSSEINRMTGPAKVQKLLKSYRAMARANFVASEQAVQHLREMGFDKEDVLDALRVNDNNQDAACDWLINQEHRKNKEDIGEGLEPSGALYKAITESASVQLGLHNPLCLIAFLMMLESPSSTQRWINDGEVGPMLAAISTIYHAERHSDRENT